MIRAPLKILVILSGSMAFFLAVSSSAQNEMDLAANFDAATQALQQSRFDGVAAITVADQDPKFYKFGSVGELAPAAESIQVDLGSISKTVTAAAILKLVETGRLSLHQSLAELLNDVPVDKAAITVHQLLTHSAGFQDAIGSDEEVISRDAYLRRALSSGLRFEPGTSYSYSNVGYSLLAAIIELTTEKSYQQFLLEDLLADAMELSIAYSAVYDPELSIRDNRGRGIAEASWGNETAHWHLIGNGGLVSSTADILAFLDSLLAGQIVSAESVELMLTPHVKEVPDETYYGYGLVVDASEDWGRFFWHNGGNGIFSTRWTYLADYELLVFTATVGRPDADRVARGI
ncbi:MAG: serine hydrolase domain-containing protein [Gammaproteobacteria bacterium]|nr:serine hydrolase domain-containing protein [Gammaproteobacteria bacterium]MDP6731904.1 serine hydrolase domain-containing protein [Gammaproteobacteria bacterium]